LFDEGLGGGKGGSCAGFNGGGIELPPFKVS
jgi:hypothetical protein